MVAGGTTRCHRYSKERGLKIQAPVEAVNTVVSTPVCINEFLWDYAQANTNPAKCRCPCSFISLGVQRDPPKYVGLLNDDLFHHIVNMFPIIRSSVPETVYDLVGLPAAEASEAVSPGTGVCDQRRSFRYSSLKQPALQFNAAKEGTRSSACSVRPQAWFH